MSQAGAKRFPPLYPILDADLIFRDPVFRDSTSDPAGRHGLLARLARELAEAGVLTLQYRNKRDPDSVVLDDARAIREGVSIADPPPAGLIPMRLILNDRAALVAAAGWHGVHLGQEDLPPRQVRSLLGPEAIIGLSTHNEAQTRAADVEPVDYIAIGPVFSTTSKSDTSPVIGLDGVRRARALTNKPLIAIGGITLSTAASVYEAGADSLAVISALFAPGRSLAQSARDFLAIFK